MGYRFWAREPTPTEAFLSKHFVAVKLVTLIKLKYAQSASFLSSSFDDDVLSYFCVEISLESTKNGRECSVCTVLTVAESLVRPNEAENDD